LWQLNDLVVRFAPNLARLYKSVSNTKSLTFVEISQETKKFSNVDFEPAIHMAAI